VESRLPCFRRITFLYLESGQIEVIRDFRPLKLEKTHAVIQITQKQRSGSQYIDLLQDMLNS
jgi:hypothetical protein